MTATEIQDLPTITQQLSGWGRTSPTVSQVLTTGDPEVIMTAVRAVAEHNATSPAPVSYTHLTLPTNREV